MMKRRHQGKILCTEYPRGSGLISQNSHITERRLCLSCSEGGLWTELLGREQAGQSNAGEGTFTIWTKGQCEPWLGH